MDVILVKSPFTFTLNGVVVPFPSTFVLVPLANCVLATDTLYTVLPVADASLFTVTLSASSAAFTSTAP